MNRNSPLKDAMYFPLCTREGYAGGCPAAAQRPNRSQRGIEGDFCFSATFKFSLAFLLLTLFSFPPTAQAGELGRLFNTPQQRQQLEFQETTSNSAEDGRHRNYIIVNGVVQKRGGNRTVWINGVAQSAERSNDKTPATATVAVPGKSRPVQLKVGQRLLLDSTPEQSETSTNKSALPDTAKPATDEDE
jgi:hypothetical protein